MRIPKTIDGTRDTLKTACATTISISLGQGDEFINSNETLLVYTKYNDRYLGYITAEHFRKHKTMRITSNDIPVYVCYFTRSNTKPTR